MKHYWLALSVVAVVWAAWFARDWTINPHRPDGIPDTLEFRAIAQNIAGGRGVSVNGSEPYSFRVPGWPAAMALVFQLGGGERACCALNGVLWLIVTALVMWPWRRSAWLWVIALLVGLDPAALYWMSLPLADPLFLCLVVAGIVLWLKRPYAAAALFGLSALVRPGGLYVCLALMIFTVCDKGRAVVEDDAK